MTLRQLACLPFLLLPIACGGDDGVDISGDSPEEAAAEVADALCEYGAECGDWEIECASDDQGNIDCTATRVEAPYDACYAELHPEVLGAFQCVDLTAEQEELVNDCVNGLIDNDCVTEEEINAYIEAIERGEEPDAPGGEEPAACDQLDAVFEGCE